MSAGGAGGEGGAGGAGGADAAALAMALNGSAYFGGGVIILKTLSGESVELLDDRFNKSSDIIDSRAVQAAFCLLYGVIFLLGVFGNVLVCFVVFRNRAMQTVTNLFISNLALADILLCVFSVPLTPLYTFLGRWVFGRFLCHLMPYAQGCSVYISTLTLTSIAVDRFFVIIYPFHPRMKLTTCIFIIIFIWIFSLLVTCPYGLFMGIQITENNTYCEESWHSDRSRKIFGVFTFILQFLIPFLVIAVCYTCVSIRLNDRARSKPGSKNSRREEADRDRKRRTNRMLIAMVAIFGISWLPMSFINIYDDFYAQMTEWDYFYLTFFLAHSMAMASTCYNPFLYAWLNENFRKEFQQVLPFFQAGAPARGSVRSGGPPARRAGAACNGNDTIQETLLGSSVQRGASLQHRPERAGGGGGAALSPGGEGEVPPVASFHSKSENVNLHLIKEESLAGEAPGGAAGPA